VDLLSLIASAKKDGSHYDSGYKKTAGSVSNRTESCRMVFTPRILALIGSSIQRAPLKRKISSHSARRIGHRNRNAHVVHEDFEHHPTQQAGRIISFFEVPLCAASGSRINR